MKIPLILVPVLMAGAMMAQQTPAPNQPPAHRNAHQTAARHRTMLQRLTARLNLTSDQQSQVKAILKDSRAQAKDLSAKLKDERSALEAAVKSDSSQEIDRITQQNAQVNAQIRAVRAKAMAKIYAVLTPDQKAKIDQRMDRMLGRRAANRSARS